MSISQTSNSAENKTNADLSEKLHTDKPNYIFSF